MTGRQLIAHLMPLSDEELDLELTVWNNGDRYVLEDCVDTSVVGIIELNALRDENT
jgi:hypothetical protein